MAELTGSGMADAGTLLGTGTITRTSAGAEPEPGSWKKGRKSSGRTAGRESSGMIAGGDGGELLARKGAEPSSRSAAVFWAGSITSGRIDAAAVVFDPASAKAALAMSSAGTGGEAAAGRLAKLGGGASSRKRRGEAPRATRYGVDSEALLGPEGLECVGA